MQPDYLDFMDSAAAKYEQEAKDRVERADLFDRLGILHLHLLPTSA